MNKPYIPLYIGDWERDTNLLTPLAEFALLKLTFKLFSAEKKGVFVANYRTLSMLFKSNLDQTKDIFQELIDNKILNISPISDDKFEIISRRMTREATISEIRSEVGRKGVLAKAKQRPSKRSAKAKQNADIDIDIEYILTYLNKKASKNFQFTAKAHRKWIMARLKEKYIREDFEKVIDLKTKEWLSTDMEKYLRPETLFGEKFDGYLNSNKNIGDVSEERQMVY